MYTFQKNIYTAHLCTPSKYVYVVRYMHMYTDKSIRLRFVLY